MRPFFFVWSHGFALRIGRWELIFHPTRWIWRTRRMGGLTIRYFGFFNICHEEKEYYREL